LILFNRRLVKVSNGIQNVFTTVTFPNHFSLATGLLPESHGIVANVMYDSKLNQTFYDFGKFDNSSQWFGQSNQTLPIWILNEKSGIIGGFPGGNVPFLNRTVLYSEDYFNKLDWFTKVDNLLKLFMLDKMESRINLGVLYFPEPDETGHTYGPYSNEIKEILLKCDQIIGYLIEKLKELKLFDNMNIIITSDHGMDTASYGNSIDLIDYVDINKFDSYGGLTQINIFPKSCKYLFFKSNYYF
jgi:ectonucleotide pyrophosphatase/phosphodiesterase family protein 5